MTPKLKICGMKYPDNIREVAALTPDYMGFIFWEKSARYFDNSLPELPKNTKKTGVFVNPTFHFIQEKINQHKLRAIQLHGTETPEFIHRLQDLKVEIIKAFNVDKDFDFGMLEAYETYCDFYLFDAKGKLPGGNGFTFDWEVLKNYKSPKPFFLSGGIGPCDVEKIKEIKTLDLPLYAIDINSKFEEKPGLKNIEKLTAFQTNLSGLSK